MAYRRNAVAVAVTALALLLGRLLVADLHAPRDAADAVVALAELTLLACLAWLWAVSIAVVREASSGRPSRLGARAPARLRRAVLLACGVALTSSLASGIAVPAPASAPGGPDDRRPAATAVHPSRAPATASLDGLPYPRLPDASAPAVEPFTLAPASVAAPVAATSQRRPTRVLVRPGDSLWSLTAALLGPDADDAAVAEAWPRLHRANLRALPDPDLLRVGQHLRVPHDLAAAAPVVAPHRSLHPSPLGRTRP